MKNSDRGLICSYGFNRYLSFVLCKRKEELSTKWHNFEKKLEVVIFGHFAYTRARQSAQNRPTLKGEFQNIQNNTDRGLFILMDSKEYLTFLLCEKRPKEKLNI